MPANSLAEFGLQLVDQLLLGHARGPLLEGLQRDEKFGIVEPRRVAAVVGPAVLGDHGHDLGMAQQNLAHLGDRRHAASSDMVGGMVPRIQRLPSSSAGRNSVPSRGIKNPTRARKTHADPHHDCPVRQGPAQNRRVEGTQQRGRRSYQSRSRAPGSCTRQGTGVTVKVASSAPTNA